MKSRTTTEFRRLFADLPKQVQEQTRRAYRQFKKDPSYPSLRFKKVHPELPIYSARISKSYRAIGQLDEDTVIWFWVGSHAEYDRLLMLRCLVEYNQHRTASGYVPIKIGIGINTGSLILGTVGGKNRMDSTVISDAVNLASRIESLTQKYGVSILISDQTLQSLPDSNQYAICLIDRVTVKGKSEAVSIFEVFDADPPETYENKVATRTMFEEALLLYHLRKLRDAERLFAECVHRNRADKTAQIYQQRCAQQKQD